MTPTTHRLARVTKTGGECSCGAFYSTTLGTGSVREQHAAHKAGAPVIVTRASLDQPAMAAHDKRTWELFTEAGNAGSKRLAAELSLNKVIESLNSDKAYERLSVSHINVESMRKRVAQLRDAEQVAKDELDAHEESYTGWARFWCVPGGHIHSSRHCSTCYPTTQFYLAHEVSGMNEKAAVEAQGPALCTVCFPSAPVEWTVGLEAAKRASQCPGSLTYLDRSLPHRVGYYAGNWGTCPTCGATPSLTKANKLRSHNPKEES